MYAAENNSITEGKTMTDYGTGWINDAKDDRDYFLETAIRRILPQEVEIEAKNIRIARALFAEDDESPIFRRAMRLVPDEEWKAKRHRVKQPPYLLLPLVKKSNHEEYLASLHAQDLFLPESVDLRDWFSPIRDQGRFPTCTAHAGMALMEYFQNRISGYLDKSAKSGYSELSWRFLYKVTRNLMENTSEAGATIRDTLKAISLFGLPPKKYWGDDRQFEAEPSAFCYAYAQNYQSSYYFRLDRSELQDNYPDKAAELIVTQIRIALASGFPSVFGLKEPYVLNNYVKPENTKREIQSHNIGSGGHALVAVGYRDDLEFPHPEFSKQTLKGAFLIRNSWGPEWGDEGYGWLPYYYVEKGLATDWWSLLDAEWMDLSYFGLDTNQSKNSLLEVECECGQAGCPC